MFFIGLFLFSFGNKIVRPIDYHNIKVEVLNACGVDALARVTTDYLRSKGFDVINYANAKEKQEKTVVIDRLSKEKEWAKIVSSNLGIDLTSTSIDSNMCVHVLILLGKDYKEVLPEKVLKDRRLSGGHQ